MKGNIYKMQATQQLDAEHNKGMRIGTPDRIEATVVKIVKMVKI